VSQPKFPDCVGCRFYLARTKRRRNPICGECDNGEFFEERPRRSSLTKDELMDLYGRMHDED
jgi:hypothetical protein